MNEKTCETCFWFEPVEYTGRHGWCEEKEIFLTSDQRCPKWKEEREEMIERNAGQEEENR